MMKNKKAQDGGERKYNIHIWIDDLEPGNGMGSAAGAQKLCAVFASLPFLPPHMASKNVNILLASIFYAKFRSAFGNAAVFHKLIDELNEISEHGIYIQTASCATKIQFRLSLILGDNLALNEVLGFFWSFVALRFCRICLATKDMCRTMCVSDMSLARNPINYAIHSKIPSSKNGLKEFCAFNKVIDYEVPVSKSADLMHDVSGGIIPYTLSKILTALIIDEELFSVQEFNSALDRFDFGPEQNKPRHIFIKPSKEKTTIKGCKQKIKIKQSASEALCLCRYLGLIIGTIEGKKYPGQINIGSFIKFSDQLLTLLQRQIIFEMI
ncbi:hypothetical protein QAD02_012590 [Eretmocerus hayati]|uniref:Uncharacterized protein n=1 Tax=Eretmocerus hayati TaxID=131215 RepID=A0ACC2P126_9HYME|nr:hypothetical protein QAD02_012590 [Eretmocerus hayati]